MQSALEEAGANGEANEIWVAQGTYKPTAIYPDPTVSGDRPSFTIPDRTFLYGGFKGDECKRCERNAEKYVTILSGDINNNDEPFSAISGQYFPLPSSYLNSKADNSRHVVIVFRANVLLDGFTIEKGFAGGSSAIVDCATAFTYRNTFRGGGLWSSGIAGGPLNTVTLRNVIFDDCGAYDPTDCRGGNGGAYFSFNSDANFENVTMKHGFSSYLSSSFFMANGHCTANKLLVENNQAANCGAFFQDNSYSITNSVIRDNISQLACPGILHILTNPDLFGSYRITCSSFSNNQGGDCGCIDATNDTGVEAPKFYFANNKFLNNVVNAPDANSRLICGTIGIFSNSGVIEHNLFENNRGTLTGGIMAGQDFPFTTVTPTNLTIKDNCFKGNTQTDSVRNGGGAIHIIGDIHADILTNKFSKNHANTNGGAIALEFDENESVIGVPVATIKCNVFDDNSADGQGSAVFAVGAELNDVKECNIFKHQESPAVVIEQLTSNKKVKVNQPKSLPKVATKRDRPQKQEP